MPIILFVVAHRPQRSPSQRFRFEQYLERMKGAGYDYRFSWLIDEQDDQAFYQPGNMINKSRIFLKSWFRRLRDVWSAAQYDLIFIQREAFMTGSVFFERLFKRRGVPIVFDFDDAIWHYDVSEANKRFGWLKRPSKTKEIIRLADAVIAGNNYLADYALRFNSNVTVIPTTIDTDYHKPPPRKIVSAQTVCIGWTGSLTTIKHFRLIEPVLRRLVEKYGQRVRFKVIGDPNYKHLDLGIQGQAWKLDQEIADLSEIDIGIMPLPDDEWAKGKCGFKGLQYMALEIPAVLSPVGVNGEIIRHGKNGLLASSEQEWFEALSSLIDSPSLRQSLGKQARLDVQERYSVVSQWPVYKALLDGIVARK